ncbi:hypothetical protein VN1242_09550 [Helicobacter pylori]
MARFAHVYTICLYYQDAIDAKEAIVNKDTKNIKRLLKQSVINKPEKTCGMIKTAQLPQGRFTTQEGRENIYYFKPFY